MLAVDDDTAARLDCVQVEAPSRIVPGDPTPSPDTGAGRRIDGPEIVAWHPLAVRPCIEFRSSWLYLAVIRPRLIRTEPSTLDAFVARRDTVSARYDTPHCRARLRLGDFQDGDTRSARLGHELVELATIAVTSQNKP